MVTLPLLCMYQAEGNVYIKRTCSRLDIVLGGDSFNPPTPQLQRANLNKSLLMLTLRVVPRKRAWPGQHVSRAHLNSNEPREVVVRSSLTG